MHCYHIAQYAVDFLCTRHFDGFADIRQRSQGFGVDIKGFGNGGKFGIGCILCGFDIIAGLRVFSVKGDFSIGQGDIQIIGKRRIATEKESGQQVVGAEIQMKIVFIHFKIGSDFQGYGASAGLHFATHCEIQHVCFGCVCIGGCLFQ